MLGRSHTVLHSVLPFRYDAMLRSMNTKSCRKCSNRTQALVTGWLKTDLPTWDGQGCLSHIGGYNDEAVARGNGSEDSVLGTSGQHSIQWQHMHRPRPCPLLPSLVVRSFISLWSGIPLMRHTFIQSGFITFLLLAAAIHVYYACRGVVCPCLDSSSLEEMQLHARGASLEFQAHGLCSFCHDMEQKQTLLSMGDTRQCTRETHPSSAVAEHMQELARKDARYRKHWADGGHRAAHLGPVEGSLCNGNLLWGELVAA